MADTHLAILLDRLVRRMDVGLQKRAPGFDPDRIGPGGSMILLTLDEMGEVPMNALTAHMVRDKSQMTRSVARLEQRELVARRPSERDRRVILVSLTRAGQAMVATLQQVLAETLDETLSALTDADKVQLRGLLEKGLSAASIVTKELD